MSPARITEAKLAGMRWLTLTGRSTDVFRTLGQLAREDIEAVLDAMPERHGLTAYLKTDRGAQRFGSVLAATERDEAASLCELYALADGAGIAHRDLLTLNLRGDLGVTDGTGCTDLAWRNGRGYTAHNEDGAPALADRLMLLTLRIEGQPTVTVHWYPGFVPSNTVVATDAGLIWGINHIQVQEPAPAAGRHFVARSLQNASSFAEALAHLRTRPSAGGFAYTIADYTTGTIAIVEAAAGRFAATALPQGGALHWHTNHLRQLPTKLDAPTTADSSTDQLGSIEESRRRCAAVAQLTPPTNNVGAWMAQVLTGTHCPGVHRTAANGDPLMTLTTTVADLADQLITVGHHTGETATMPLRQYLRLAGLPKIMSTHGPE